MMNKSKKRGWKTYDNSDATDLYFIYRLPKKQIGDYLNVWFDGEKHFAKTTNYTYTDVVITLKKVDKETAEQLYGRIYNPVQITIMCPTGAKFLFNEKKEELYNMKFHIHSIDDASYGIWWENKPLAELKAIREKIMELISNTPVINGENLLDYCVELGADIDSKDYN